MKPKRLIIHLTMIVMILSLCVGSVQADDGVMTRRNISKTPDGETEKAGISMMYFYVPAQAADGTLLTEGITYVLSDTLSIVDTRYFAKPLTAVYIDEEHVDGEVIPELPGIDAVQSGVSFGEHDTFVAHSLDDGATWKTNNLSRSADLSSFNLKNGHAYPGDTYGAVQVTAGNRVMAAWQSRYCDGGNPLYTYDPLLEIPVLQDKFTLPDLYVTDIFGVQGTQKSVDYTLQGFPEVGEIPYGCVWTARGELVEVVDDLGSPTGTYDILWTKAERLTSGKRDANRLEIDARPGGGFVITWQEDPEGLRPGQGLGPGEGWSGAIVNNKTDIWYSYISWDQFDLVDPDGDIVTTPDDVLSMSEFQATYPLATMPKVAVPMAMPVRLTDNNLCKSVNSDPYCYVDFDILDANGNVDLPDELPTSPSSASDLCSETIQWTNPGGTTLDICKTEDGRMLTGRVGSSRARIGLYPISAEVEGELEPVTRYFLVMAYEETKALGDVVDPETLDPIDIGKNVWYHSFEMFQPDLASQGGMLNQPAVDRSTGAFYELLEDPWGNPFYETEIARRFALVAQPYAKAMMGETRTTAFLIYKQGIINQGGPADVFARRIVLPDDFDPAVDNPYDFKYIPCDNWEYADGSNPYYLEGICLDPAINFSGNTIVDCDDGSSGADCAAAFPWDGGLTYPKVLKWSMTADNEDDQSWENPYDVAKGHRGFLDGDFLMLMYAWAPNWKANTVGNDHYNLYVRRSFDGGQTFKTTPAELGGSGTTLTEYYGHGNTVEKVDLILGPGVYEPSRNVSLLVGNKITVLDPRYTPTGGLKMMTVTDALGLGAAELPYSDDAERDASRFFIIFETGDNTTVAFGEATPLDLYYSRASVYGDIYDDVVMVEKDKDGDGTAELVYEWDWVENQKDDLSGEAGMTASPMGTFMYSVWNQWQELEEDVITNSDIIYRRIFYNELVDAEPTATILTMTAPAVMDFNDTLVLNGAARDGDHLGEGMVSFLWTSDVDGVLSTTPTLSIDGDELTLGTHVLTFTAMDNEGNWARGDTFTVYVFENLQHLWLPMAAKK